MHRLAAIAILFGAVTLAILTASWLVTAYTAGQREILDKRAQLRSLRDLSEARDAFNRLSPRGKAQGLILSADADAEAILTSTLTHAAEGQQVVVDGVEPLSSEPVMRTAMVHLRGTQAGIYNVLKALEDQTPYMLVPRLELTPSRAADPEHGKPFVIGADLRLAVLTAPPLKPHKPVPALEPAP